MEGEIYCLRCAGLGVPNPDCRRCFPNEISHLEFAPNPAHQDSSRADTIKNDLKNWAKQFTDKEILEEDLEKVAEQILGRIS